MKDRIIKITEFLDLPMSHVDGPVYKYKYEPIPIDIEVITEDNRTFIYKNVKSSNCKSCYSGKYIIYSIGDVDGPENRCNKCGHQVWGPVYI